MTDMTSEAMGPLREDRRPLAMQVRDRIWEAVQDGTFQAGQKLPTEAEFAGRFRVSRATVREALKLLEDERVVICRRGVGRFLALNPSGVLSEQVTRLKSVTELAHGLRIDASTSVLAMEEQPADNLVREHLGLAPESTIVRLERLRSTDNKPIIYSVDIFARHLVVGDLRQETFTGSLMVVMEASWGIQVAYSKAIIRAVLLSPQICRKIGVPKGSPWILLEQIHYDPQDRPILYSMDYHLGEKFQFHVLRRRR